MREILFKAKRTNWRELPREQWWVSGGSIIQFLDDGIRSFYIPQFNEKCICKHDESTDDILSFSDCRFYKVDPETICQYTGLTDKNGNMIWENDILRYSYDYPDSPWLKAEGKTNDDIVYRTGNVFWQEWRGSWAVTSRIGKAGMNIDVFKYCRNPNRTEVIGNIFENPELLEAVE